MARLAMYKASYHFDELNYVRGWKKSPEKTRVKSNELQMDD